MPPNILEVIHAISEDETFTPVQNVKQIASELLRASLQCGPRSLKITSGRTLVVQTIGWSGSKLRSKCSEQDEARSRGRAHLPLRFRARDSTPTGFRSASV